MNYKKILTILFIGSLFIGKQLHFTPTSEENTPVMISTCTEETSNTVRLNIEVQINDKSFSFSQEKLLAAIIKNELPGVDLDYEEGGLPNMLSIRVGQIDKNGNYNNIFAKDYSRSETEKLYNKKV